MPSLRTGLTWGTGTRKLISSLSALPSSAFSLLKQVTGSTQKAWQDSTHPKEDAQCSTPSVSTNRELIQWAMHSRSVYPTLNGPCMVCSPVMLAYQCCPKLCFPTTRLFICFPHCLEQAFSSIFLQYFHLLNSYPSGLGINVTNSQY